MQIIPGLQNVDLFHAGIFNYQLRMLDINYKEVIVTLFNSHYSLNNFKIEIKNCMF